MTNQQQGYFCPSFSTEQYYNEYFTSDKLILDQIDQHESNENKKQTEEKRTLILTPYQPLEKRGRGRPKGSCKLQSPTTNTAGKKTNQSAASKRNKPRPRQVCTDMLKIEHRKNFSVITVLNSKRLVINCKKTDSKCLTGLPAIKDKLGGNYGKDEDRGLFEPEQNPNLKTLTINEEKLIFYNFKNHQSTVTSFGDFEMAINNPKFKHVDSRQESTAKLAHVKVPSKEVSLNQVYGADNVVDHEQNKFIVIRKELNPIAKVVIEKPVKDVESHRLLKCKPYYCLTGQEVYENMDFDSFIYDLEKVNHEVTQVNLDYQMDTGASLTDPNQAYQYYEQQESNLLDPLDQSVRLFNTEQQINPDLMHHLTQQYDLNDLERILYYDSEGRPLVAGLEPLQNNYPQLNILDNPSSSNLALHSSSESTSPYFNIDQLNSSQFEYQEEVYF